jgi:hypothetical protein
MGFRVADEIVVDIDDVINDDDVVVGGGGGGDRGDSVLVLSVNCTGKIRLTDIGVICPTESLVIIGVVTVVGILITVVVE